jgi:hypothetical protein
MTTRRPQFNDIQIKGRSIEEIKTDKEKKKKEELEKKAKPKVKQLRYYDVKVEVICPTTLTYRVYAETESDALELIKKISPTSIKPDINRKKLVKASVYDAGGSIIKHTKVYSS